MCKAMVILAQFQLHFVGKKGPSSSRIELLHSFLLVNAVNLI